MFLFPIGIDGGGGFFKVCLNIIVRENADDLKSPPKKKQTKKATFKDGGVKKLVVIGIVEEILETYFNVKTILNIMDIEKLIL